MKKIKYQPTRFYANVLFKSTGVFEGVFRSVDIYFGGVEKLEDFPEEFRLFKEELFIHGMFHINGKKNKPFIRKILEPSEENLRLVLGIYNDKSFVPPLVEFNISGESFKDIDGNYDMKKIEEDFLESLTIEHSTLCFETKRIF